MYIFGELPSDLEEQSESMGPPPPWFKLNWAANAFQPYAGQYSTQFYGLGERTEEVEVNPLEELQDLKFNQEMDLHIPTIANRYTEIDPLSPLFRTHRAKYGFGIADNAKNPLLGTGLLLLIIAFIWLRNRPTT